MMDGVRGWLMNLIAVSLLCAVADALMPAGGVRRVGRLVCGLVLLAVILSPVVRLDAAGGRMWLADCLSGMEARRTELEETVNEQMKTIIEGEYAAYIVDKAAEAGVVCGVRVECRRSEEGLYLPAGMEVSGALTQGERDWLSGMTERDLGIPKEAQVFETKEEMP